MSFLLVLGTHAMLEYPLQYAYFLLPAGLVMGCLNVSLSFRTFPAIGKWFSGALLLLAAGVLAITIRDYFRVETSFYGLRFEQRKIEAPFPRTPPEVVSLTQWHDYILFARIEPRAGMPQKDLDWMRGLVATVPSAYLMYRFAAMLALNGQPQEAQVWLKRIMVTTPSDQWEAVKAQWGKLSSEHEQIAKVPWPAMPE